MRKGESWFVIAAWYMLLAGVLAAGVSRFGGDYMVRRLAEPSLGTALFLVLALMPVPFVFRRASRS